LGDFFIIWLQLEALKLAQKIGTFGFLIAQANFYILTSISSFKTWSVVGISSVQCYKTYYGFS
jgi:hypothetical protein